MPLVTLPGREMQDWDGFHRVSRREFGFPDFYGNNLDAWIDCLSGVRDDDGMSRFVLKDGETLEIAVSDSAHLARHAGHVLEGLQEAVQEVNLRCEEAGQAPPLRLRLQ